MPIHPLRVFIGVLAMLVLATLACNAPGNQVDSAATVQVFYVTITAQAGVAPLSTQDNGATSLIPTSAQTVTPTSSITPTPPESRSGNGSNLIIVRCTTSVIADAKDMDWTSQSGVISVPLNQNTYGASEWSGSSDLSGNVWLCWNDSGLYLFADVVDDLHVQNERGETSWKGDEVEFLFDTDLRGDFYKMVWDNDDYQVGLNPGNFTDLVAAPYLYHPTIGLPRGVEMNAAPTGTGGNYRLEAEILWDAALGMSRPTTGQSFGMCVALSDNDHTGVAQQDSMVGHCSQLQVSDPTTWITVTLQ